MKKNFLIALLFGFLFGADAQEHKALDSLYSKKNKLPKKEQLAVFHQLVNHYEKNNNDSALALINEAILLCKELKDVENEYVFKTKKVGISNAKGNFNEAIEQAENIIMEISSLSTISQEKRNLFTYDSYNNIGIANANMGNYSNALYYYQKNVELSKTMKEETRSAVTYTNIGLMYYNLYEDDKALAYYSKAKTLYEKHNHQEGLSGIALNIGAVYHEQGELSKALDNYFYSLKIETERKDKKGQAFALNNIADVYRLQKKYDKALEYNEMNLAITEELGNVQSSIYSYNNLCDLYKEMNKLDNAEKYAQKSYQLAEKHHLPLLVINSLQALSEIAEKQNNYKEALNYQKLMLFAKDSLTEKNKSKTLLELEAKYQNEQNQKDIQLKNAEIASQKSEVEKKNLQTRILMVGILAIFALVIVMVYYYNQKKKINEQLKTINDELEKLSVVARETDNVVIIADANGDIEWINESYTKVYGFSIEEFREKFGNSLLSGSSNPEINNIIKKCITDKVSVEYVLENQTKSGRNIWVQTTMTPVLNQEGNIEKFILIDSDITKLQEAQFEIEKQSKLLELKNEQIIDSIDYAKRIQSAVFPAKSFLDKIMPKHFIFFKPKDIVSGDFYWVNEKDDELL
ncbi:MAG TPA: tetratricopeptide repeat protein, partial [Vicingus sp.]|nr:tetratricopeptide repeat protein [Vicingus sp.]